MNRERERGDALSRPERALRELVEPEPRDVERLLTALDRAPRRPPWARWRRPLAASAVAAASVWGLLSVSALRHSAAVGESSVESPGESPGESSGESSPRLIAVGSVAATRVPDGVWHLRQRPARTSSRSVSSFLLIARVDGPSGTPGAKAQPTRGEQP